jgi:glycerol-3-phosphate acyltransferase PlsY
MLTLLATTVLAYALGCINTGYYLVRARTGDDLRSRGSGTAGATNTGRVLGRGGFVAAMAGDVLKGVAAVALARWLAPGPGPALAAVAVVAGHVYPAQLGLRGGKGLATTFGAAVSLAPLVTATGVAAALAWLAATRRLVEAAMVGVALFPIAALALRGVEAITLAAAAISGLVLTRHTTVIRRLIEARRAGIA